MNYKKLIENFDIDGEIIDVSPYGEGHINDTVLIETEYDRYILQKINTNVFKKPAQVMDNIVNVTTYLKEKINEYGGDCDRETMTVIPAKDGQNFCEFENEFYRVYTYIKGTKTYQKIENAELFCSAGQAFGHFQKLLGDFPADELYDTIPDFHNTPKRVEALKAAIEENLSGRADMCKDEIEFALNHEAAARLIVDGIDSGDIPLRVTHNDTKLNNILFDGDSDEGLCVIDLDTVMPGSMLYDFGDSIRFGASTGAEDEKDLSKVNLDMELYEAFTKGFSEPLKSVMTDGEKRMLPDSALVITLECGIRFLTDFLNGDTYFKTNYPEHNLDRCRTQFKLVKDMEEMMSEMRAVTEKYVN